MKNIVFLICLFLISQSAFAVDSDSKNIAQNEQNTSVYQKEIKQKSKAGFFKRLKEKSKVFNKVKRFIKTFKKKNNCDVGYLKAALIVMVLGVVIWFTSIPIFLIILLFLIAILLVAALVTVYIISGIDLKG